MFVDAHTHLEHAAFRDDVGEVVQSAKAAGVGRVVCAGGRAGDNARLLGMKRQFPDFVKIALGLAPHFAATERVDDHLAFLETHEKDIVGVGEIGLDYHHYKSAGEQEKQRRAFQAQLALAEDRKLPVVVHARKADEDVFRLLRAFNGTVVLHFFLLPKRLDEAVARGYFLSLPTIHCKERRQVAKRAPLEQLLCETDAPYGLNDGSKRNEPANVVDAYRAVADARQMDLSEAAQVIAGNAQRAFPSL